MAILNSKIYLAKNIKLDSNYKNVLSYSESTMLDLVIANSIASSNTYQFIRERNSIHVDFSYAECVESNYIAYQNPDYSNKWFFAFIDEVNYKSNKSTEIKFTIDVWSTWYGKWSAKDCMIIREHVNDDTLGKHTVPENLETGEFITQYDSTDLSYGKFYVCVGISEDVLKETSGVPDNKKYNGVVSGLTYIIVKEDSFNNFIFRYNELGKIDSIVSIFMVPENFASPIVWITDETGLINFKYVEEKSTPYSLGSVEIRKPAILGEVDDSYTPKNNKMLTFPYVYLVGTNNAGADVVYKYEDFGIVEGIPSNYIKFETVGSISAGCSIKCVPIKYKQHDGRNYLESFNGAKLPLGGWINDVYANWLRQNGLNVGLNVVGSVAGMVGSVSTGQVLGAVLTGLNIGNTVASVYQQSLVPNQAEGNINSSDIMFSAGKISPSFYQMTIKTEYAKIIDKFLSRFGYLVNITKNPNLTGRPFWNYIKLGDGEDMCLGQIPTNYSKIINKIGQTGTTIWHNHENIGNFDLDNSLNN